MRLGSAPTCSMMSISPSSGHFVMLLAQHPDRRPGAAGARQLGPDFVEAVGPAGDLRNDLGRGVILSAPIRRRARSTFVARLDRQHAVGDAQFSGRPAE